MGEPFLHAYTIVDAGYRPWLPGWLHWHRERYDRLFVLVLDQDPACVATAKRYGATVLEPKTPDTQFITTRYSQVFDHAATYGHDCWYSMIDVDEIVDPSLDVRALARWCVARGLVVAFAHMIDRVPPDGRPAPIGAPESQFEAFPVRCCFGRDLTGWNFSKPFLRRSEFWGLHRIDNVRGANRYGCSWPFELCHFDFTTDVPARCEKKIGEVAKHFQKWWRQYFILRDACANGIDVARYALPPVDMTTAATILGADDCRAIYGASLPANPVPGLLGV